MCVDILDPPVYCILAAYRAKAILQIVLQAAPKKKKTNQANNKHYEHLLRFLLAGHEPCFTQASISTIQGNNIQQRDVCAFAYMYNHNADTRAELNKYVGVPYNQYYRTDYVAPFLDLYPAADANSYFGGAIIYGNIAAAYQSYSVRT